MPSGQEGEHLFVVLNNPTTFHGYGTRPHVVLVSISTVRPGIPHDPTCVLPVGCHPFVKSESYVVYKRARIEPAKHVEQRVQEGFFKPNAPMPAAQFAAIKAGLRTSPFVKREFKELKL